MQPVPITTDVVSLIYPHHYNISVLSWQSVLLVEETGVPEENHWPATSHWQTLLHNVVSSTPHLSGIRTHNVSGNMHWLHTAIGSGKLYDHVISHNQFICKNNIWQCNFMSI
jgi:hypothetical protein